MTIYRWCKGTHGGPRVPTRQLLHLSTDVFSREMLANYPGAAAETMTGYRRSKDPRTTVEVR